MLSTAMLTKLVEAGVRIDRKLHPIKKGAPITLFPSFEHLWNYLLAKQSEVDDFMLGSLMGSSEDTEFMVRHGIRDYKSYTMDSETETLEDFLARIIIDVKQEGWIK